MEGTVMSSWHCCPFRRRHRSYKEMEMTFLSIPLRHWRLLKAIYCIWKLKLLSSFLSRIKDCPFASNSKWKKWVLYVHPKSHSGIDEAFNLFVILTPCSSEWRRQTKCFRGGRDGRGKFGEGSFTQALHTPPNTMPLDTLMYSLFTTNPLISTRGAVSYRKWCFSDKPGVSFSKRKLLAC